ncbi:ATPase involved in DNA repair [Candidatus Methanoperedens nitroreducens]|uniref:ATPase involved in DNA repair n=1 Tax=Candidatus Methanoperedens nitratireducens TaxID=1392998 RepID=A0A062V860_9EURY|nr:AAA family ATPase [Candidatus Methanoperedens nitroreducens]KCZ71924.1 ATPase involved in DNA repair [Candidatus Methanoperedens nitroreducens]MDJ1422101.1 AAA family ATPase [Candidatus Methanoperedens sp.]
MLIKSVELKNIKSYSHETIEFMEGINGIYGQNGHGKTTILESIGYVLFDFLPYNASDLLRHGEKSGYVAITVEGNDEIEYTIYRKIGSDYYIKTPVDEIKGKKDVLDWIAGNLFYSVRSPDDLPSIFENAVGVPQGTFTTAFLQTPRTRKMIFDNILRVEEYQAAYANLLPVINSIKKNIDSMDKELLPLRTRTEKYQDVKKEKETLQIEIDGLKNEIKEINTSISILTKKKEELTSKKAQIDALSAQITNENVRLDGRTGQLERARFDLSRAESARKVVDELLPSEEAFKKENLRLKELNSDRVERDKLKDEIARVDSKISSLMEKLERSSKLSSENIELEERKKLLIPRIEAARRLEESIHELQKDLRDPMAGIISNLANLREKEQRMKELDQEIENLRIKISHLLPFKNRQLELEAKIKDLKENLEAPLRTLSSEISVLKEKEGQAERLRQEIFSLTERKNKLMPVLEKQRIMEDEIKNLSSLMESLTRLGFELRQAVEKEKRANLLISEVRQLGNKVADLAPLIEQQTVLEKEEQDLNQRRAAVKSMLEQTRNNMRLAGAGGLCPVLNGVKCRSVSDFTKYFNDELNSRTKELEETESRLNHISNELIRLNNPKKQREEIAVLIASKKKDLDAYSGASDEVESCRTRLKELAILHPLPGSGDLTGSEEERSKIFKMLESKRSEYDKIKNIIKELDSVEALIQSKNKDMEDFFNITAAIARCEEQIGLLNSRFNLNIGLNNTKAHLDKINLDIKSLDESLKDLNDPSKQIDKNESLILCKQRDLNALKEVPSLIKGCLEQLALLNNRFHLKDRLDGNQEELRLVDEIIKNKTTELKALNSPEKEYEALGEIIRKNLKELEALGHVPESLESCRHEREDLMSRFLRFKGLDESIASVQEAITELEPEHNKYLQHLPLAIKVDEYSKEAGEIEESIVLINAALNEYTKKQEALLKEFNGPLLDDTILKLEELGRAASGRAEAVNEKSKNLQRLVRDLENMESWLLRIKEIEKELEDEKQFLSFSNFIRDTIKNSSEHIVNEFIGEISSEASGIYCEIMDGFTSALKWANDYDIEIESEGQVKSFKQLSGGERMGAALAVRLALLKVLSNCDFMFLDEPTQNMDEIRREKLSDEILRIRGFKQVFVISHDDTFNEKYEHVVRIQKIDGESRVVSCST